MNSEQIAKLFEVVKKKNQIDQTNSWSNGSSTYLQEIKKELDEVEEEILLDRICYLEDELGDVLWDYLPGQSRQRPSTVYRGNRIVVRPICMIGD
jgi:NTP pyrophosphatase (non-canonical NTP hydrolase)